MSELEIKEEINNFVNIFNTVCKQIGEHLKNNVSKNRNIHIYNDAICDIIKKKPSEPISIFVTSVYANDDYRESIINSNESFFTKNDHTELTGNDSDSTEIVAQVKNCWAELNKDSKFFIKEAFKTLINLCDMYIEKKDDLNKLCKSHKNKNPR